MSFAKRLSDLIYKRKMSQGQVAQKTGIGQSHISQIASGQRVPSVETAAKIARGMGVSLNWLCDVPERVSGALTPDEDQLLRTYRSISNPDTRQQVLELVSVLAPKQGP